MKPVGDLGSDPLAVIADDCAHLADTLGAHAERLSGRTVFITGAAGMLASYMVDAIVHLNDTGRLTRPARLLLLVRSLDANEGRLAHLRGRSDVKFLAADAASPYVLDEPVHLLVHAASPASPTAYRADPDGTRLVNIEGTSRVLDWAQHFGAESVLYVSTSEVYGNPPASAIPTPETFAGEARRNMQSPYVYGKVVGEGMCTTARVERHLPVKIVRPFHYHGPGLKLTDGRIVAELIRQGLDGEPLTLKSDGLATRTYGYAADAAIAFLRVLLSEDSETFNVGAEGPETSMRELATIIAHLFGQTTPVRYGATSAAAKDTQSPDRVRPDVSRIRMQLGVVPTVPLEAGLARTIHWHRMRRQRGAAR